MVILIWEEAVEVFVLVEQADDARFAQKGEKIFRLLDAGYGSVKRATHEHRCRNASVLWRLGFCVSCHLEKFTDGILPSFAIEVGGDETGGVIGQERINAERFGSDSALDPFDRKRLMRCFAVILVDWRVAARAVWPFPSARKNIAPTVEARHEDFHSFLSRKH